MRTMSRVIRFTVALSLSTVTPVIVSAQEGLNFAKFPRLPECARADCSLGGRPVLGAPFSAEAITVWRPPSGSGRPVLRATARYYRDSAGRVRVEQFFVGHDLHPQRTIVTPDANDPRAYLLDPDARTVSTPIARGLVEMMVGGGHPRGVHVDDVVDFELPVDAIRSITFWQVPAANSDASDGVDEESLERSIEGIRATGTRFTTRLHDGVSGSGRGERWVSPELKLVVYGRSEDSEMGVVEYQLTKISRAEPAAELFEVPAGYVVTPFSFRLFPMCWGGPDLAITACKASKTQK